MRGCFARTPSVATGEVRLRGQGLSLAGAFRAVSYAVQRGEFVCFSGLAGARRRDVALAMFWAAPAEAGVHQILCGLAAKGQAIIVVSSDLSEVLSLADRLLVMREGRLMAAFAVLHG